MTAITPTVGRVVWYMPSQHEVVRHEPGIPLAAIVAFAHSDRLVNLMVIDAAGKSHSKPSVALIQPDETVPSDRSYCAWMPFQIGQAKKHEAQADGELLRRWCVEMAVTRAAGDPAIDITAAAQHILDWVKK